MIRERRPELVISVTTMLPAVPIAARLERVPALVYCGELFDRGFRGGALRALASRALAVLTSRLAAVIIACSETVAGQFIEASSTDRDRLPAGRRALLRTATAPACASASGSTAEAPVLASVGYLTEGRGQDVLAAGDAGDPRAAARARATCSPATRFPRPQDLAYRDRLLALIDELGLGDAVIVAGHFEEVADVYAAADVIVNPARFNEPFGRVPFEAAIAGRPAVVTRVGAIPELLRDERSALIVDPGGARASSPTPSSGC